MSMWYVENQNELYHYGIKGMRWGKRKKFNVNQLSPEDRQRYSNINGAIGQEKRNQFVLSGKESALQNQYNTLKRNQEKLHDKFNSATSRDQQRSYVNAINTTDQGLKETQEKIDKVKQEEMASKRNMAAFLQEKSRMQVQAINSKPVKQSVIDKVKNWFNTKVFITKVTVDGSSKTKKGW